MPQQIVMDVDTGIDDALALLYAIAHPELEVVAISCVAGNAALPQVVVNTCKILELAGAEQIPVTAGAARPLLAPPLDASYVHGSDGMGDLDLPQPRLGPVGRGALEMLPEVIRTAPAPLTLVATAPQTNVALLLGTHPELAETLNGIVFMGGSAGVGNATAVAEYNIWCDPEAAAIVLNSGARLTMYGLDVFNELTVPEDEAERLSAESVPALHVAGELLLERRRRDEPDWAGYSGLIGDAGVLVMLTDPELFTVSQLPVQVNLTGLGRGQTLVDQRRAAGADTAHELLEPWPVVGVALDLDREPAAARWVHTLREYYR